MAEEEKNPSELSELENHYVDLYVINCATLYHILRIRYNGPKDIAKRIFIKTARSKIKMAENYLFSYGYRNPPAIFSPTELNKMLKRDLGKPHGLSDNETYLRPADITQILQELEQYEVYHNVKGKKEVRRQKRIGSEKPNFIYKRSGGRPSAYMISDIYSKSNEIISKPEVRNLIRKKLIDYNIGLPLWKYIFMAIFYSFKIDKEAASKILLMVGPPIAEIDPSKIQSLFDEIASLDENKFEELSEWYSKLMLDSGFHFSVTGFLGLMQHK
jgi:hypothetical protein